NMYARAGLCLQRQGKLTEALAAFQKAHQLAIERPIERPDGLLSPNTALKLVRECDLLIELEKKLPAILRGYYEPASAAERMDLARLCAFQQLYEVSARLYEEACQAERKLVGSPYSGQRGHFWNAHRFHAACSAALAGAGQGQQKTPLDESMRVRWRQQALAWLRSDLAVLAQ